MSRTDGHAPVWVHIRRGVPGVRIGHDHTNGPCDFDRDHICSWMSRPRWFKGPGPRCTADLPYYSYPGPKYYKRTFRRAALKQQFHQAQRARWNIVRHKLLTTDPWDVEDELGFRPRGSVAWDEW